MKQTTDTPVVLAVRLASAFVTGVLLPYLLVLMFRSGLPPSPSDLVLRFASLHALWALGMGLWALPLSSWRLALQVSMAGWLGGLVYSLIEGAQGVSPRYFASMQLLSLFWLWLPSVLLLFGMTWLRRRILPVYLEGCCSKCGYSLRGLNSAKCPECGTPVLEDEPSGDDEPDGILPADIGRYDDFECIRDEIAVLRKRQRLLEMLLGVALFLVVAAAASLYWVGQSTFDAVFAERVWLGESGGHSWGRIEQRFDGNGVQFVLSDVNTMAHVTAGVDGKGGPYISMGDAAGKTRFEAYLNPTDGPRISLRDSAQMTRLVLMLRPDDTPLVAMLDDAGEVRLGAEMNAQGLPRIDLRGAKGHGVDMSITSNGLPSLCLFDRTGSCRIEYGIGTEDEGVLAFYDHNGRPYIQIEYQDGRRVFLLKTESGNWIDLAGTDQREIAIPDGPKSSTP